MRAVASAREAAKEKKQFEKESVMNAIKKVKLAGLSCLCAAVFLPSVQVAAEVVRVASGDATVSDRLLRRVQAPREVVDLQGEWLFARALAKVCGEEPIPMINGKDYKGG